jgi:hypothetical protein
MSRLLMVVAWMALLALVAALVTHRPEPWARDAPPQWYVQICAEVSTC